MNTLANSAGGVAGAIFGTLGYIALVIAYWVPTIVAWRRHVPAKGQVLVVNLFLGWTFIGWVIALVMALRTVPQGAPPQASRTQ
jgi:Superinfection immunity protein